MIFYVWRIDMAGYLLTQIPPLNFPADGTRIDVKISDWEFGRISSSARRLLFATWVCDAVAKLMKRRDIIRRAFRATGVGIDADGKMKHYIRYPGFVSYIPPERDEEHEIEELTEQEIQALEKKEAKLQKRIKKRKQKEKEKAIRERARKRMKGISTKPTI